MEYYKISNLIDLEVIGKYPQIDNVKCNCDPIYDELFIDNIGYSKVDFTPKTPLGILNEKSKTTDLLSSPSVGYTNKLLISYKLKEAIINLENDNFQVFKTKIELNTNKQIDYWILNPIKFNYLNIDFDKSDIYLMSSLFDKVEKLDIKSFSNFSFEKERIQNLGYPYRLFIEKVSFDISKNNDFLIIDNVNGGIGYYVSEKLKNKIQEMKLTGIQFDKV